VPEFLFDFLMRTAEEASNRRLEQHFIREERLEVGRLFEPLMPRDARTAFGAEKKGHLLLRKAGTFPICADIVW